MEFTFTDVSKVSKWRDWVCSSVSWLSSVFSLRHATDLASPLPFSSKGCVISWSSCCCAYSHCELSLGQIGQAYQMEWQVSAEMSWKIKPSMTMWGGILPESRFLRSTWKWQNGSISVSFCLWPFPLAACHSGSVAISLSYLFGFPKGTTSHSRLGAEEQVSGTVLMQNCIGGQGQPLSSSVSLVP